MNNIKEINSIEELEKEFISSLYKKTTDFVNEAMKNLVEIKEVDKYLTFTLINIQLANEFSLKASVASRCGLKSILNISDKSDENILKQYRDNKLKINEYEKIKNFAKSSIRLTKKHIKDMTKFQEYRNRTIHSIYDFSNKSIEEIKKETISYFLTVINYFAVSIPRKSDDCFNVNHLSELLDYKTMEKLRLDTEYLKCVEQYVEKNEVELCCVYCDFPSVTDDFVCLLCLESFKENSAFGFADCSWCFKRNTVVYDNLNLRSETKGYCMSCEEKILLMNCTDCGTVHCYFHDH